MENLQPGPVWSVNDPKILFLKVRETRSLDLEMVGDLYVEGVLGFD